MDAEVVAIGDEITSGQTLDTNSQWLSQRLEELGVRVLYHSTVGDELEPCVGVFRQAMERADVVVVTGGLGPTADDLTREALARATERPLQLEPAALEQIRGMFARRNRPMPAQNELQAMFPVGSQVIYNPHGTAPGIDLTVDRGPRNPCRVICLPGVPAEMIEMWHHSVAAAIEGVGGSRRVVRHRRIHCFGAGESQIEAMLPDLIRRGRHPTVGITASKATITLRITAEGEAEPECYAAMEPTVAIIHQSLGRLVFGEEDDEMQDAVVRLLRERGKTLATCECGTTGLVGDWLGSVADSADVYRGGLIVMHCSESVEAMAKRQLRQMDADIVLAIGPILAASLDTAGGAQAGSVPSIGLVLATAEGVEQKTIPLGIHPALERIYAAKQALNFLRLYLLEG